MTNPAGQGPHTLTGDVRLHADFESRYLGAPRSVIVYCPPDYRTATDRRYPVLYLHDGQNLFDQATAFAGEWRVDETAQALISAGKIEPLIIVGVYNGGAQRIDEYTPTSRPDKGGGG